MIALNTSIKKRGMILWLQFKLSVLSHYARVVFELGGASVPLESTFQKWILRGLGLFHHRFGILGYLCWGYGDWAG